MAQIRVSTKDQVSPVDLDKEKEAVGKPLAIGRQKHHRRHISPFWRHYLQMAIVMAVGMFAGGAILVLVTGITSWDDVTIQYPNQALLVMAAGMSIPMVAWMLLRGMGWRNSCEMAAAMVLPVFPFLCLVWFGVTTSAQCGAYCVVTFVAMFALMRFRRSEYSMQM
jgi:hypothetical protein